jgi:uncharacterized protein YdhG (YjbR/CyaY superfamily)
MVQSTAATVDEYMQTVEPDRREALDRLRGLCREILVGWDEKMGWGMPGYGPPGSDPVVSWNSQKRHIALYAGRAAIESAGDGLNVKGVSLGGGCIRYSRPAVMDFDVIADMLRHIRANKG